MSAIASRTQPATPFPSALIDQVMPRLKDTEWRLLCVIVRQTLGWKDKQTGARKTSDWLTQKQLIKRTGRSSEALSRALDSLVRQQIIEVRSSTGTLLSTTAQRRQTRGRIHYALHSRFQSAHPMKTDRQKSEYQSRDASAPNSLYRGQNRKSEFPEAAKANGTKENTKETFTKRKTSEFEDATTSVTSPDSSESGRKTLSRTVEVSARTNRAASREIAQEAVEVGVANFVRCYREKYAHYRPHDVPPDPFNPKSFNSLLSNSVLAQLEDFMHRNPDEDITRLLDVFFTCDLSAIRRGGYSLVTFVHCLHLLRLTAVQNQRKN